jgi:hypothetical protein
LFDKKENSLMNSSWIFDTARSTSNSDDVVMTLENGKNYLVEDVSNDTLRDWQQADSAGSFFNASIRSQHTVTKM